MQTTMNNANELLTTGASEQTKIYNIYDMAGNVQEYTDETSFEGGNTNTQYKKHRGRNFNWASSNGPIGCRNSTEYSIEMCNLAFGFRVTLYIK